MDITKIIPVNMKAKRLMLGKTVAECCLHSGISISVWYQYEDGKRLPSVPKLDNIADALDATATYLISYKYYQQNLKR